MKACFTTLASYNAWDTHKPFEHIDALGWLDG